VPTLGLTGIPPDVPTWGNMLSAANEHEHLSDLPLLVIAPGLALALVIVSLHLVGDGPRAVLDPRRLSVPRPQGAPREALATAG
jgi:ABC-type dipeptide/oligopeptide/nickel transport system permease subunit